MKELGFIQIAAPGFHLRGDFPIERLSELVDLAIKCITSEKESKSEDKK